MSRKKKEERKTQKGNKVSFAHENLKINYVFWQLQ